MDKDKNRKPAFEEIYDRHYFEVLRYLNRRMGNSHDAEDLAGDVFLYCYQHYDGYDPEKSSVTTWLYLVVNSRLKNYYRDRKPQSDFDELEDWLFSDEPDMERSVWLEQLRDFMAKKLKLLPERQRQVVIMRFFQNMDYDEIAQELGTSQGNVRVILTRSLAKLREYINDSQLDWSM